MGAFHLAAAFTGRGHQKSQEEEAGAGQREDQEFVGLFEESKSKEVQLRTQKLRGSSLTAEKKLQLYRSTVPNMDT